MSEVPVSQALRIPIRADIVTTAEVIAPHIRRTPILETAAEDFGLSGAPITFKLEYLQHSGTFKARGAFANILMREGAENGVVAASGGNHGAAVAYAAMKLGYRARIFVPSISSPAKIAKIKSFGADIVVGGETYAEAYLASREWATEHGGLELHAFDAFETVCGQGTLSLELAEQAPALDTVLVAVGGGGLVGGAAAYYENDVKIVGVEPFNAPSMNQALAAGRPVDVPVSGVAADSLGARRVGQVTFPLAQKYVDGSVLVTDEAIVNAQKVLWDVLRVVTEPGGAAAMAALLSGAYVPAPGEKVGVVLCGANTTAVSIT
jgi:threonine dehydratase